MLLYEMSFFVLSTTIVLFIVTSMSAIKYQGLTISRPLLIFAVSIGLLYCAIRPIVLASKYTLAYFVLFILSNVTPMLSWEYEI